MRYPKKSKRNKEIIGKALLPDETLYSVAKAYGISCERVRQIIEKKLPYKRTKNSLFTYLRCVACGSSLSVGKHKYCKDSCRIRTQQWDFSTLKTCSLCKIQFYPYRNWEFMRRVRTYCCVDHYIEDGPFTLQGKKKEVKKSKKKGGETKYGK
jgi:hypothetical protein